jgi:hypothetical protein
MSRYRAAAKRADSVGAQALEQIDRADKLLEHLEQKRTARPQRRKD